MVVLMRFLRVEGQFFLYGFMKRIYIIPLGRGQLYSATEVIDMKAQEGGNE